MLKDGLNEELLGEDQCFRYVSSCMEKAELVKIEVKS